MSPELDYFVALIRCYVGGGAAEPPVPRGVDWQRLQALVVAHRVSTALAGLLHRSGAPATVIERCDSLARNLRRRDAVLSLELSRLLPALEDAGCRPIALKGAALGPTIYPARSDRFVSDIDLLIDRRRLDEGCAALAPLGYAPAKTLRHPEFYERHHFHRILRNAQEITVELHWDLTRPADFFRFDLEGFRRRTRVIDLTEVLARVPAEEDQLLHAASQSLDEGFVNMWRVIDAALLLRAGAGEHPELAERAAAQKLATPLWVLLRQADEIAGVAAPQALIDAVAPGRASRRCIDSLDVSEKMLSSFAKEHAGHRLLLEWLCAPDVGTLLSLAYRFVVPGEAKFLATGRDPDDLPGLAERTRVGFKNGGSLAKILLYQARCLATRRA